MILYSIEQEDQSSNHKQIYWIINQIYYMNKGQDWIIQVIYGHLLRNPYRINKKILTPNRYFCNKLKT